jgi:uncharacterized repeat protein (TIGR01451 family)
MYRSSAILCVFAVFFAAGCAGTPTGDTSGDTGCAVADVAPGDVAPSDAAADAAADAIPDAAPDVLDVALVDAAPPDSAPPDAAPVDTAVDVPSEPTNACQPCQSDFDCFGGLTCHDDDNNPSTVTVCTQVYQAPTACPAGLVGDYSVSKYCICKLPKVDLSLQKTVSNSAPLPGATIMYSVTISNNSALTASGIHVKDVLPAGVTFASFGGASFGTYNATTQIWTIPSISPFTYGNLVLYVTVDAGATGTIVNTAEIIAAGQADPDSVPNNGVTTEDDIASVGIVVTQPQVDLSLQKTVSNSAPHPGDTILYSVTISNSSAQTATGIQVTDVLPAGVTFASFGGASFGTYNSATQVWTIPSITPFTYGNLALYVTVDAGASGNITNTAEITAAGQADPDSTPNNAIATEDDMASVNITVSQPKIDLSLKKTVSSSTAHPGDTVMYSVTLSNNSAFVATGIQVTDILPVGVTFASFAGASFGSYNATTQIWSIPSVTPFTYGNIAIYVTVDAGANGNITNTAEITAAGQPDPDSTPGNGVSTEDDIASVNLNVTPLPSACQACLKDSDCSGGLICYDDDNDPATATVCTTPYTLQAGCPGGMYGDYNISKFCICKNKPCGDGKCGVGETCGNCPKDCGECDPCGDVANPTCAVAKCVLKNVGGLCGLLDGKCGCVPDCKADGADGLACDDGDPCTVNDICKGGGCVATAKNACDDGLVCTDDGCDPKVGCIHKLNSAPCEDGNACTGGDQCKAGACEPGSLTKCDDGSACTTDACDSGKGCIFTSACDDGDGCTSDFCGKGGICAHTAICTPGMVLLPAGTYEMGAPAGVGLAWEHPQHLVTLSAFELDKTEVTVADYTAFYNTLSSAEQCGGTNSSGFVCGKPGTSTLCNWNVAGKSNDPINCVDWYQAAAYCAWKGDGRRLPTEAEWEYAARGGGTNQTYPWGTAGGSCTYAVYFDALPGGCGTGTTASVCSKTAGNSSQGICDLGGNVAEWCSDWQDTYPATAQIDPTGPATAFGRVIRGGGFDMAEIALHATARVPQVPYGRVVGTGFRCARSY